MINTMTKNDKRWIGDLLGGSLMVRESRTIAELLLSEPDETTWQQQIINENILQASSTSTANRYARTLNLFETAVFVLKILISEVSMPPYLDFLL